MAEEQHSWRKVGKCSCNERISQFLIPCATSSNTSMSKKRWLMWEKTMKLEEIDSHIQILCSTIPLSVFIIACRPESPKQIVFHTVCIQHTLACETPDLAQEISRVCMVFQRDLTVQALSYRTLASISLPWFSHACCSAWESPSVLHRMQAVNRSTLR